MNQITKLTFAITITTSMFLTIGCGPTALNLNKQACVHLDANEVPQAQLLLNQSLDLNFEKPQTHLYMGQCFKQQGRYEKAIYEYRLAVKYRPSYTSAQIELIKTLDEDGQKVASKVQAMNFLEFKAGPVEGILEIANTFASARLHDQAIIAFRQAQKQAGKQYPPKADATVALGDYYYTIGQNEAGLQCYREAFAIDPVFPGIGRKLGQQGLKIHLSNNEKTVPQNEDSN